jgi:hypothetical protein
MRHTREGWYRQIPAFTGMTTFFKYHPDRAQRRGISTSIAIKYSRSSKKSPKQRKGDCYLLCIAEQLGLIKLVAPWGHAN